MKKYILILVTALSFGQASNQMVSFTQAQSLGFSLNSGQSHVTSNQCMTKSDALTKYNLNASAMSSYANNQLVPRSVWGSGSDTTPPSVPTNLVIHPDWINYPEHADLLTWAPSTDNVGVVSYDVFVHRDGVYCDTFTATETAFGHWRSPDYFQPSYFTSRWGNGTYYFKVRARDAAANVSAYTNEVSIYLASNTPPPSYQWNGKRGSLSCVGGQIALANPVNVTVYSASATLDMNVFLYTDAELTQPYTLGNSIRVEDRIFSVNASGMITSIAFVGDPC